MVRALRFREVRAVRGQSTRRKTHKWARNSAVHPSNLAPRKNASTLHLIWMEASSRMHTVKGSGENAARSSNKSRLRAFPRQNPFPSPVKVFISPRGKKREDTRGGRETEGQEEGSKIRRARATQAPRRPPPTLISPAPPRKRLSPRASSLQQQSKEGL